MAFSRVIRARTSLMTLPIHPTSSIWMNIPSRGFCAAQIKPEARMKELLSEVRGVPCIALLAMHSLSTSWDTRALISWLTCTARISLALRAGCHVPTDFASQPC